MPLKKATLLAAALDAPMIARRLWDLSWKLFPPMGRYRVRTLATWAGESEVYLWALLFVVGIVGILMARRDARSLLYWNLCCLMTLTVASPPLIGGVEHSLCIAASAMATVTMYFSRRHAKALPS